MHHMDPIRDAEIHGARIEAREGAYVAAHQLLIEEAVDAFKTGGAARVMAHRGTWPLREAFVDFLAGPDALTDDLLRCLQACSTGAPEARVQAMALIATFARHHADLRADEVDL